MVKGPGVVVGRAGSSMGTATYSDVDFWPLNTSLFVTDFLGNHPRFTFYLLSHMDFSGYNSGAAQPMLNRNYIKQIPVEIPPFAEQQAIADTLGALDDKILANEQLSSTHELLLQCKFTQLGLSEEPDPAASIPVTDLITFNPKTERPTAERPIYVDMAALSTSRASITSWTRRPPKSGTRFRNGDTLLARITPCLENGKTGYVDFMESGEIGLGSTEFIVMRTVTDIPSELAYFLARDERFREHAMRNMSGSSGRQRVSAADASNYLVNKPDSSRLLSFGEEAAQAFAHWRSLENENRTLAELRDTLLPQLVTGKIRVKDAEHIVEDAT
jgi:type I restriction enzyme S subunit